MADYTVNEKEAIKNLCIELNEQLGLNIDESYFDKSTPHMGETPIYLTKDIIIHDKIKLDIWIEQYICFSIDLWSKSKHYSAQWYDYLENKYGIEYVQLPIISSPIYIKWFVSEIGALLNDEVVPMNIYHTGKISKFKKKNIKVIINKCRILK